MLYTEIPLGGFRGWPSTNYCNGVEHRNLQRRRKESKETRAAQLSE